MPIGTIAHGADTRMNARHSVGSCTRHDEKRPAVARGP
jgi:hypothetical protein